MKIRFTEEEVKEAVGHYVENESGLNMNNPFTKPTDVEISFLDYKGDRVMVSEVQFEIKEKKDEDKTV